MRCPGSRHPCACGAMTDHAERASKWTWRQDLSAASESLIYFSALSMLLSAVTRARENESSQPPLTTGDDKHKQHARDKDGARHTVLACPFRLFSHPCYIQPGALLSTANNASFLV